MQTSVANEQIAPSRCGSQSPYQPTQFEEILVSMMGRGPRLNCCQEQSRIMKCQHKAESLVIWNLTLNTFNIGFTVLPSGQCPLGTSTLPPTSSLGFDLGEKCWENLEAFGLWVGNVPLLHWASVLETGDPVGGPAYPCKKKRRKKDSLYCFTDCRSNTLKS